jgi:hypothetical protein
LQNDSVEQLGGGMETSPLTKTTSDYTSKIKENKESVAEAGEGITIHFWGMGC